MLYSAGAYLLPGPARKPGKREEDTDTVPFPFCSHPLAWPHFMAEQKTTAPLLWALGPTSMARALRAAMPSARLVMSPASGSLASRQQSPAGYRAARFGALCKGPKHAYAELLRAELLRVCLCSGRELGCIATPPPPPHPYTLKGYRPADAHN